MSCLRFQQVMLLVSLACFGSAGLCFGAVDDRPLYYEVMDRDSLELFIASHLHIDDPRREVLRALHDSFDTKLVKTWEGRIPHRAAAGEDATVIAETAYAAFRMQRALERQFVADIAVVLESEDRTAWYRLVLGRRLQRVEQNMQGAQAHATYMLTDLVFELDLSPTEESSVDSLVESYESALRAALDIIDEKGWVSPRRLESNEYVDYTQALWAIHQLNERTLPAFLGVLSDATAHALRLACARAKHQFLRDDDPPTRGVNMLLERGLLADDQRESAEAIMAGHRDFVEHLTLELASYADAQSTLENAILRARREWPGPDEQARQQRLAKKIAEGMQRWVDAVVNVNRQLRNVLAGETWDRLPPAVRVYLSWGAD